MRLRSLHRASTIRQSLPPRTFTTSTFRYKGLQPDTSDPEPPNREADSTATSADTEPTKLSDSEYHEISDQFLNTLVLALEDKVDSGDTQGLEVEYSAGVLTITHPRGTYVLNKQPPNKQIWLSSPLSGPKRYDWVASNSSQHDKQDSEMEGADVGTGGRWVYLRDGSSLSDLLRKEVGVEISRAGEDADATTGREGPGGSGQASSV